MKYTAKIEIGNISFLCFSEKEYLELLIYLMERHALFTAKVHE